MDALSHMERIVCGGEPLTSDFARKLERLTNARIYIQYGPSETTPGGRALKFYASVRLDVRRAEWIKDGSEQIGNRTRIRVVKNKVAPPFKAVEVDIIYGKGISKQGGILDIATEMDIVNKSGSWFSYNGQRIGQGRENVKQFLFENPEICNEIEGEIRKSYESEKNEGKMTVVVGEGGLFDGEADSDDDFDEMDFSEGT
jgi:acyl-CoA synthetase (AMP-forming)/AMP-acid ligase II